MPIPLTAHANSASLVYLRGLLDYVQARGLEPGQLLQGQPIDFDDRDARLPESACAALFDRAAELLGDDALGLHAGEQIRPGHYGALGYVAMNCATLGEALTGLRRYHALVLDIGPMQETLRGGELCLSWNPGAAQYRHLAEYNLAGLVTFSRWISGRQSSPLRIDFNYPAPPGLDEQQRVFKCPLRYAQDCYRLVMPQDWLSQPLIQPDSTMRAMMELLAERQMQALSRGNDAIAAARGLIAKRLGEGEVELGAIATALHLSARTLQRKLQDAGLSFTQLIDEVRRELAERYLADHTLDLVDIAFLLGYSEQSAFTRAYKRWTGHTPASGRSH
ncbi:MAG TPA: AraC family transcriptional regulator [Stenotrophobium sp.]|jgi:AraC-like DNA-binding protein|nr:AraC family transcriptional regulator [Stenotrophobium sp.]